MSLQENDNNNIPNGYFRDDDGIVKLKPELIEKKTLANKPAKSLLTKNEQEALKTMNDGEIKQFAKKLSYKVIIELLASPYTPAAVRLGCAKEAIDRDEGKPAQTSTITLESKGIDKLTTDRLLALEQHLARITGANALVIPPMPKKLGDDC